MKTILIFLFSAALALGCLGLGENQVVLVVNDEAKGFTFSKGVESQSLGGSQAGKPCNLVADFTTHRASQVCGERVVNGGDLIAIKEFPGTYAWLLDNDSQATRKEDFDKIKKYVEDQPRPKGGCIAFPPTK